MLSHLDAIPDLQAGRASRHFDENIEWHFVKTFLSIAQLWGKPEIDLFAWCSTPIQIILCYLETGPWGQLNRCFYNTLVWLLFLWISPLKHNHRLSIEDRTGGSGGNATGTQLAYTTLVHHTYADGHRLPTTVASVKKHPDASLQ